jgi:putative ABC transport system substrate-binding protein
MRRREFLGLLGGAAATWPVVARAQSSQIKRIGILMGLAERDGEAQARIGAFRQGLRQLGWTEGENIRIDYHWGASGQVRSSELAIELMGKKPNVILTNSPTALAAAKKATSTIPIVFVQVADPVSDGFVTSLAHPGGNITGFAISEHTMCGKWLEIIKEIAPRTTRVGFIQHVEHPSWPRYNRVIEELAPTVGFEAVAIGVRDAGDLEAQIVKFATKPDGALLVLADTFNTANRKVIIALAIRQNIPAVYPSSFFATDGGLLSYGGDLVDLLRRAASYVDRILKGDNPGDLPIQQATKFDLILNLKTAKAIGLTIPSTLLARANEVVE